MAERNFKYLRNLNVLYVEDDPLVASQTVSLLEHFFHTVFHADNAEKALRVLKSEQIHLLITDIELPGMSGLKLCEEVRKTNRKLPIFITTVHDDREKLQQAVKLNLVDYLIKPISIPSIQQTLAETLKRVEESGMLIIQLNRETYFYPLRGVLEISGTTIPLTKKEITLLELLLKHSNQVVTRETIEQLVYPDEPLSDSGYKNLIYRLRKKIGKESISTLSGVGIKLKVE